MLKNKYDEYRKKMTFSYKYFRMSQEIVITSMTNELNHPSGLLMIWTERYLKQISNLLELLLLEGETFMDYRCLDNILKATDHAKKVMDCCGKKKDELEIHHNRCCYNKASSLILTNRLPEAALLLKKVY